MLTFEQFLSETKKVSYKDHMKSFGKSLPDMRKPWSSEAQRHADYLDTPHGKAAWRDHVKNASRGGASTDRVQHHKNLHSTSKGTSKVTYHGTHASGKSKTTVDHDGADANWHRDIHHAVKKQNPHLNSADHKSLAKDIHNDYKQGYKL